LYITRPFFLFVTFKHIGCLQSSGPWALDSLEKLLFPPPSFLIIHNESITIPHYTPLSPLCNLIKCWESIDISWVDWSYNLSTYDVIYRWQHRYLYYGGQNLKTVFAPLHRSFNCTVKSFKRNKYIAERTTKSNL
jgi:hypothetical protein